MKYAIMDASVDHGKGEGTVAEMFTAAMQSLAFFENDIKTLLEKALTYIPEDSRIARCVRLVMREYEAGTSWLECREKILAETADMTVFQAPANIAYAVLGLLYGEKDFKKSIILAVNCGDDTDCTGATVGATLGIMYGSKFIPKDWSQYIGDRILTVAIDGSFRFQPKSCTELTERIMMQIPGMLLANGYYAEYSEKECTAPEDYKTEKWYSPNEYNARDYSRYFERYNSDSPYSNEYVRGSTEVYTVDYLGEPTVKPLEDYKIKITLHNHHRHPNYARITLHLPEGWTADYPRSLFVPHKSCGTPSASFEITVHVGERIEIVNHLAVTFHSGTYPAPFIAPITLLG